MKTKEISILIVFISLIIFGQVQAQIVLDETEITPPKFPDQQFMVQDQIASSIDDYLNKYVKYPIESAKKHLSGTEVIRFEVSPRGELTSFHIINSVSPEIDREVIRVLETTSGHWIPGTVNGTPESMPREVSLAFLSHPGYDLISNARQLQDRGNKLLFVRRKPKSALKFYNQAATLLPFHESILAARSLCRYELGDKEGALMDLERIMALNPEFMERMVRGSYEEYFAQLRDEAELNYLTKH